MKGAMTITPIIKWTYTTRDLVEVFGPTIANVDNDNSVEVVFGSNDNKVYCLFGATGSIFDHKVYCLSGATGSIKWSYKTGNLVVSSPAIGNVDNDDSVEVIIGSHDSKVFCLSGSTGNLEWSYTTSSEVHRGISLADVDGDNILEVLVPNMKTDSLIFLNGEDGSLLWVKELAFDVHDITPADVDGDSCIELVVGIQIGNKVWILDDSLNSYGCGSFPTSVKEKKESIANNLEMRVVNDEIYLLLHYSSYVKLSLYDICGRRLKVIYDGNLASGRYTFKPNIRRSGIYFVKIETEKDTISQK